MRASRDFTTGTATGGTAVLEPTTRTRVSPPRRYRSGLSPAASLSRRSAGRRSGRLGSQQVVSRRGRRTETPRTISVEFVRVSATAIALLIVGVIMAMWFSGISVQQTFRVEELAAAEAQLTNQNESLERDLANLSSTAELARRSQEAGFGVPHHPGILEVIHPGEIVEQRVPQAGVSPIIDVNGAPVRPGQASSDPRETREVSDKLEPIPNPQPAQQVLPAVPAVAPYAPGARPQPNPQPNPAPTPAPAPSP